MRRAGVTLHGAVSRHPQLISQYKIGVWCTGSHDVGLIQSTKAPEKGGARGEWSGWMAERDIGRETARD